MYNNIFNIVRVGRVNVNKIIIAAALLMRFAKLLLLRALPDLEQRRRRHSDEAKEKTDCRRVRMASA